MTETELLEAILGKVRVVADGIVLVVALLAVLVLVLAACRKP